MKKYIICICDDERSIREQLRKYIVQYSFIHDLEIDIIELESADQLYLCQRSYDILFLDIRFGNQNIGIDVAESLRTQGNTSIIIIMTFLKAMLLEGYRAEPFRFLLKPLTENQIHTILTACMKKLDRTVPYIRVMHDSHPSLIRADRILYICSKARRRQIVCTSNEIINTWQSLNELIKVLPAEKFALSHKSYIVNLDVVDLVKNGTILLTDGTSIPLGAHFKDTFMKMLLENAELER